MFDNESVKRDPARPGGYGFDRPSRYLTVWSRLFQSVISQAGCYLLTGSFHKQHPGIFKCEGGCNIPGVGDLVLLSRSCYFDIYARGTSRATEEKKMASLISHVVLGWDPENPVDSMIALAAEIAKCPVPELIKAVEESGGGPFSGDALNDFFDHNPFADWPTDRKYERWCRIRFNNETPEQVDQMYADIDLGREYREKINRHIREAGQPWKSALCCSPRRDDKGGNLMFWINTGGSTQIDGWLSESDIKAFLASDGKLNNKR